MENSKKTLKLNVGVFEIVLYAVMFIFAVITIYPMFYTLVGSFNDGVDFDAGGIWLFPRKFTTDNYAIVIQDNVFWHAFFNTVIKTVIGTFTALIFTSIIAYALSRSEMKGRKTILNLNLFTMFFSGGLIPYYLVIVNLNLYDSFLVYILPALYSVYNMLIMMSFFKGVSNELHEAALIDGANEYMIYWRIYMPLSKPVLATVGLWIAVGQWNSYFNTLIYTNAGNAVITLQYYLLRLVKLAQMPSNGSGEAFESVTSTSVSFAAIIVATVPILCVYPLIQRYFVKGIMLGAVKG